VLTVIDFNELEINHSVKEIQHVHAEYSVSIISDSAGWALNFISANDFTYRLKNKNKL
jgi:hypothetical protein